jgi:alkanesulfonate monooxygenase SsuD/methylene tetrahydromethanopterin reductase-like flavin-dependent oxidoreductase (luciferase family)
MGVVLRDALPWHQALQVAQVAEDTGYEALFVPEIAGREAFSALAGFAGGTGRLRLGTGVVTMWSRAPVAAAMAAATVHDLSGGRLILGLGSGSPVRTSDAMLLEERGPIELMRAYVLAVRDALSEHPVQPGGPFGGEGFRMDLELPSGPPPIWLAALGDRMLALAGEVADGVVLNWCTPERVGRARRTLDEAAARAGRDPKGITVSVYVRACLGQEDAVAVAALMPMAAQYAAIPHYRAQMRAMGLGDEADAAAKAFEAGRPLEGPEDLVRALTVWGGRKAALARFEAYRQAGADLVLCYPVAALEPFSSILGTVLAAAPSPAVER